MGMGHDAFNKGFISKKHLAKMCMVSNKIFFDNYKSRNSSGFFNEFYKEQADAIAYALVQYGFGVQVYKREGDPLWSMLIHWQ